MRANLQLGGRANYGMLGHIQGAAIYQVPLSLQAIPAV